MGKNNYPGKLIVFCGLDGSGKTTLINNLNDYLCNLSLTPVLTKQPTPNMRNNHIFRVFQDQKDKCGYDYRALSLLAAADRLQHSSQVIVPALNSGNVVISDRYFYSCLANLQARGYENDQWIYDIAKKLPLPDVSFFLDINVDEAIKRVRSRPNEKDRYIDIEMQYKLRDNYLKIAEEIGGVIIHTYSTIDKSFEEIKNKINKLFLVGDNAMETKLFNIIKSVSPYESKITYDSFLKNDLGFNSLKMVELIFEIEKEYGFEFDDNDLDISKIKTVKDLEKIVITSIQK